MAAGKLFINDTDAFTAWGLGLEPEGLDALCTPAPNKEPVTNNNVTASGVRVVTGLGLVDARNISINMHIIASGIQDLVTKRNAFYNAIKSGLFTIRTVSPATTHTVSYISFQQYTQIIHGLAKFTLSVYEPNEP